MFQTGLPVYEVVERDILLKFLGSFMYFFTLQQTAAPLPEDLVAVCGGYDISDLPKLLVHR